MLNYQRVYNDGWNPINNGMFPIYQLVIRISLAHPQYVMIIQGFGPTNLMFIGLDSPHEY